MFQKAIEKTGSGRHSSKRKCASCRDVLPETWTKVLCRDCIQSLVRENELEQESGLAASVKELSSTFSSFKSLFERLQPLAVPTLVTTQPQAQGPAPVIPIAAAMADVSAGPSQEEQVPPDSATSDSQEGSDGEDQDGESRKPSRYKLSLDEVEDLLGAVYTTLGIQTDKKPLTLHDRMYRGLEEQERKVFPVHDILVETIKKEWQDPERKPFFSRSLKRRFPFSEDPLSVWNKSPKLDAAFSQVSRNTDLAFEDMGVLSDVMDKRMDSLLKKCWDSTIGNLKPELAVTVMARNLEHWLSKIQEHIEAGTDKETILASFPTILQGVAYIADASAESVRMSARSAALANSARRALWLKTWTGDSASKSKLCGIPFTGDLLFGPGLEAVLDRTADKKKAFPPKRKVAVQAGRGFRPQKQKGAKPAGQKRVWTPKGRGRGGAIFHPPVQPPKNP